MLNESKEVTNLQDLKGRLWKKIQKLDDRLEKLDTETDEYRKALDAYQKIVKSFLDIYKLEATPGFDEEEDKDAFTELLDRITKGSQLPEEDKKQLIAIKRVLSRSRKKAPYWG